MNDIENINKLSYIYSGVVKHKHDEGQSYHALPSGKNRKLKNAQSISTSFKNNLNDNTKIMYLVYSFHRRRGFFFNLYNF